KYFKFGARATPHGPAAAVAAARAQQERSFGASLFGGRRLAPDTGPVRPLERSFPTPKAKPGPAAVAARGRDSVEARRRTAEKLRAMKPARDLARAPHVHAQPGDRAELD